MLHVTNGESVVHSFRAGAIPGIYLAWADSLHDGPVPVTTSLEDLSDVRAQALSSFGWGTYDEIRSAFAARDRAIADCRNHEEVVLWFEHDLYDQLQLIQLLDWFSAQELKGVRLSLIQVNAHPEVNPFYGLGQLNGKQLQELLPARKPVSTKQLALGRQAWSAFRAADPTALLQFAHNESAELPYLAPALRRFLEEYPSVQDGLSRTQRQILQAGATGKRRKKELYSASRQFEPSPWADASVYLRIDTLASGPTPALDRKPEDEFVINEHGNLLLAGRADWIRSQKGIDVWFGGVHLCGDEAQWRWNNAEQHLIRSV